MSEKVIKIPCQVYGKQLGHERSSYRVISCAAELREYERLIARDLSFQWLSLPHREHERYRDVWYVHVIDEQRGLLCHFQDVGADPRPHVLRRTVGLIQREQHAGLLTTLRAGLSLRHDSDGGIWSFYLDEASLHRKYPLCSGWRSTSLQAGCPETYLLAGAPPAKALKKKYVMNKTLLTHLACLLGGTLLSLLLMRSCTEQPLPDAVTPPRSAQAEQRTEQQYRQLIAREHTRLCQQAAQLHTIQQALHDMRETMQHDLESFQHQHREQLSPEQIRQIEEARKRLLP